jgi:multisubunit Na+/H+ antiporter MnhB subunit
MEAVMSKLNMYSIIVVVLIILLFAIGKIFGNKADSDEENEKKMSPSRFRLVRFVGFAVIFLGLFLNSNAAYEMNSNFYTEITGIEASDFDIGSIDLTLRDLLNIEYDF